MAKSYNVGVALVWQLSTFNHKKRVMVPIRGFATMKNVFEKFVKKLNLEKRNSKKTQVYLNKAEKILKYCSENTDNFEKAINNDELKDFALYIHSIMSEIVKDLDKKKGYSRYIQKLMLCLFMILFAKDYDKDSALIMDRINMEIAHKTPKELKPKDIDKIIAMILTMDILGETTEGELIPDVKKLLFPSIKYLINDMDYDDWIPFFIHKTKKIKRHKTQLLTKYVAAFIINYLDESLSDAQNTKIPKKETDKLRELSLASAQIIHKIEKPYDDNAIEQIYSVAKNVGKNGVVLDDNIEQLLELAATTGTLKELAPSFEKNVFSFPKEKVLDVICAGDSSKLSAFFNDSRATSSIVTKSDLEFLYNELENKNIYNAYYDSIGKSLGKKSKRLSQKIEVILKTSNEPKDVKQRIEALRGDTNTFELLGELQAEEKDLYENYMKNPAVFDSFSVMLREDLEHLPKNVGDLHLDVTVLRLFQDLFEKLNRRISDISAGKAEKNNELLKLAEENNSLKVSVKFLNQKNQQIIQEKELYVQEFEETKKKILQKEKEHESDLIRLKQTLMNTGNRGLSKDINSLLLKLVAIRTSIEVQKNKEPSAALIYLSDLIDQELESEGVESFGKIGEKCAFDETKHQPVTLSSAKDYIEQDVIILEMGYRFRRGGLLKKAIVNSSGRSS
jgi:hypothetical protein